MSIVSLLDSLASQRQALLDAQAAIAAAVPDLKAQEERLAKQVDDLEKEVKERAKYIPPSQAHTLVAHWLQLVWANGRVTWVEERLTALALKYGIPLDELDACKEQGHGWWAIKKRGNK